MVMPSKTGRTPATVPAAAKQNPATVVPAAAGADPEAGTPPRRRTFSAKEKLRILTAADEAAASGEPGAIGAILRREGIYSSMLGEWRRQRDDGAIKGLTPCRRGPQPEPVNPLDGEVARLRRENARLKDRLARAEQILEVQKKVSEMLAIPLKTAIDDESI